MTYGGGAGIPEPAVTVPAWNAAGHSTERCVPEETAVALTYNRVTHAVMMATPRDLHDFAIGFSRAEAIIDGASDIEEFEAVAAPLGAPLGPPLGPPLGIELRMWIAPERMTALERRRRHIAGPTGCGLCGMDSLADAMRAPAPVLRGPIVSAADVDAAMASIGAMQMLNRQTRAVHAAGFWRGGLVALREDVGRHNALDKLTGALLRMGEDPATGIAVMTSRISVELVQKAATAGIAVLAAISAPTALAIRVAQASGITLVGVARIDGFEVFTHRERVTSRPSS